ncbi:hypothetical protein [Stenotrophomonas rhizophila]|uniref:hypothetical protein n=1 Tax=Stenotrophomonas rhizophila TaxID=216778 RepID=UPI0010C0B4D2|nr:hypothetical protein [Stenotrophomonas rhizophila]TKK09915.1 hypothetical protein SrhCFBP13529_07265 [Stenotrophomonas rhizophila]
MSFDIIILKPTEPSANDLSNVEDVLDIGSPEAVITFLELVFPGCAQGAFSDGERYALESAQCGDPVTTLHLTLRYGPAWSEAACAEFLTLLSRLCQLLQSVAFAVSDNSRITPPC